MAVPRILVVDDFEDLRKLLAFYLGARGYEVIEAATGKAAIDTAIRKNPNFILLDLCLPDMNGVEVARSLQNLPETKPIPIVGWTADDCKSKRVQDALLSAGILGSIQKPALLKELEAAIDRFLLKEH
jgi:CheY-like chemotaxis protein